MSYRFQKNITITEEQKLFLENNFGKMDIGKLSAMLGLGYNKVHKNLRLMGKVKTRQAIVIDMRFFDVDGFAKKYYAI